MACQCKNEVEDLKNDIIVLTKKVDSIFATLKINNLAHDMNYQRSREHQTVFENVFPNIIRRITAIENKLDQETKSKVKKGKNDGMSMQE